jgi:predicted kinase
MQSYLDMAAEFRYEPYQRVMLRPWKPEILHARNMHNVPLNIIETQIARFEESTLPHYPEPLSHTPTHSL